MTMTNDAKFEKELTCPFKTDERNLTNFDRSNQKSQKFQLLMGCFWPKCIMFDLRKYREVVFDITQDWNKIWRKNDFYFQKRHQKFGKFSPEHLKSQNWDFDGIPLSKLENVLPKNLQGSYLSWQWRMIQKLKRYWLVNSKFTWGI